MNSIFYNFLIAKTSIALLSHAIVDLVHPNSAIDSKKLQFAIDLFGLAKLNSPIASAIDPSFLDLCQ